MLSGRYASEDARPPARAGRHTLKWQANGGRESSCEHLVALDAVAREGSFRRAATHLGYVQSAISHQIAALENLTGKRLIERSRGTRPLALTDAGEILLAHADALIARVRAAQADLAALDGNGAAALRVGCDARSLGAARAVASARLRRAGDAERELVDRGATHLARARRAGPRARRDAAAERPARCGATVRRSVRRHVAVGGATHASPQADCMHGARAVAARRARPSRARRGTTAHARSRTELRLAGRDRLGGPGRSSLPDSGAAIVPRSLRRTARRDARLSISPTA